MPPKPKSTSTSSPSIIFLNANTFNSADMVDEGVDNSSPEAAASRGRGRPRGRGRGGATRGGRGGATKKKAIKSPEVVYVLYSYTHPFISNIFAF